MLKGADGRLLCLLLGRLPARHAVDLATWSTDVPEGHGSSGKWAVSIHYVCTVNLSRPPCRQILTRNCYSQAAARYTNVPLYYTPSHPSTEAALRR